MQLTIDRGGDQLNVTVHPAAEMDAPLVVIMPAMGVPGGYYGRLAPAFHQAGLSLAIADLRGNGASTPKPSRASRYGYDELTDDVAAVLDALRAQQPGRRTVLLGHSLGGQISLLHLARATARGAVDPDFAGLALIAVGLPYWRDYPARVRLGVLGYTQAINLVSAALRFWPGWTFGGRQARGVIRDWAYTARTGGFPAALGPEATGSGLAAIRTPVLAISVDHDQYTPPATTDQLVAMLPGAKVRREHLTVLDAGVPLDHFIWVKAGPVVAARLADWLRADATQPA
jgi:predicted alpha/beta hydrolase